MLNKKNIFILSELAFRIHEVDKQVKFDHQCLQYTLKLIDGLEDEGNQPPPQTQSAGFGIFQMGKRIYVEARLNDLCEIDLPFHRRNYNHSLSSKRFLVEDYFNFCQELSLSEGEGRQLYAYAIQNLKKFSFESAFIKAIAMARPDVSRYTDSKPSSYQLTWAYGNAEEEFPTLADAAMHKGQVPKIR